MSFPVKALFLVLALVAVSTGAPERPATVALDFLEKVRSGSVDLEPGADTAMSPLTGAEKRREIASRLERLGQDLGAGLLEAGEVMEQADHAAVLVYHSTGYDPARVRVFPVALVRREDGWLPAPVPASFENTGLGYPLDVRQRLAELERWMIRQQIVGLDGLRQRLAKRLKEDMASRIDLEELLVQTPSGVVRQFLAACSHRDLPAMLGFLGGLEATPPNDWSQRMRAAENAVAEFDHPKQPWRLLMAPEVVRTLVHEETLGDKAQVRIACIDPFGGPRSDSVPRVEFFQLELTKARDGFWQVDPPARFFSEDATVNSGEDDLLDEELLDRLPEKLRQDLPAAPSATLEEAVAAVAGALRATDPRLLLRLLDLTGDPRVAWLGCTRAARAWRVVRDPASARRPVVLGSHQLGSTAVVVFQFFSSREPDRAYLERFFLRKGADGWLLAAGLTPDTKQADEETKELLDWVRGKERDWQKTWRDEMLAGSIRLESLNQPAPSAEEARTAVKAWLKAIADGDVARAISLTAWLGDERGAPRVLRNLSYEVNGARNARRQAEVEELFEGEGWCAVGALAGDEQEPLFPLYPVVSTPEGARLLIEIDLFAVADGGRKRDFLNTAALNRLRTFASAERIAELRGMLEKYQTNTAAVAATEGEDKPAGE